jgi:hypothetical protein
MMKVLQFIFSDLPDVRTALYRPGYELICHRYAIMCALFVPLPLFSRRVECYRRLLADVILISMEVLQESFLLNHMFHGVEGVRECLHVMTAHFLAR